MNYRKYAIDKKRFFQIKLFIRLSSRASFNAALHPLPQTFNSTLAKIERKNLISFLSRKKVTASFATKLRMCQMWIPGDIHRKRDAMQSD